MVRAGRVFEGGKNKVLDNKKEKRFYMKTAKKLNSNMLKTIAVITMFIDHLGVCAYAGR